MAVVANNPAGGYVQQGEFLITCTVQAAMSSVRD